MIQDIEPQHLYNEFVADAVPVSGDPVFHIRGRQLLLMGDSDEIRLPTWGELGSPSTVAYLFSVDEQPFYLALDASVDAPTGFGYEDVRAVRSRPKATRDLVFAAFTALHLAGWYAANRYCGVCGTELVADHDERMLRCPACGHMVFPRINPAVIVAVRDGDRILLTKYAHGRGVQYHALIAGFCEIGETAEQTVAREVAEEVGLKVHDIRYYKTQPWGIVDDLLLGFWCDVDGDAIITRDERELAVAEWVERSDVDGQPDNLSLTNEMMCRFRDGLDRVEPERP